MTIPFSPRVPGLLAAIAAMLSVFAALLSATAAFAQAEREAAARALVVEAFTASRLSEIAADARGYIVRALLPVSRDIAAGKLDIPKPKDPAEAELDEAIVELSPVFEKAATEFEGALLKHREEMIDDLARIVAKHMEPAEIEAARAALRLELTRKGFDTIAKVSQLIFSFNYEEERAKRISDAWLNEMQTKVLSRYIQWKLNPSESKTPTPEHVAKANSLLNEVLDKAHADNIVASSIHVSRVLVMPFLEAEQATQLRAQVDQIEQNYGNPAKKQVILAAFIQTATQLVTKEELKQLQEILHSTNISKYYETTHLLERAAADVKPSEVEELKRIWSDLNASQLPKVRSEEDIAAIETDLWAFGDKWGPRLLDSLSPESRDAVSKFIDRFKALDARLKQDSVE